MRRLRSCFSLVVGIALTVLVLITFAGPAVYVELAGREATGVITARREEISVRASGWSRSLRLEARYTPADTEEPEVALIPVSVERYDGARVGDEVRVRYMPRPDIRILGEIAAPRLGDQGPLGQLAARLGGAPITFAFLAVFLVLLAAWGATRRGWLLVPLGLLMLGFAMYAVSDPPRPAPPGPQLGARATVRVAHEIDRLTRGRARRRSSVTNEALQPYTVVALEFVPRGAAGPVVAVDLVDAGSVPGLEVGAELPISYSVADPRWARIEGARRTYFWKNLYGYALVAGVVALLALGLWLARRRARTRRQQP